MRKEEKKKLGIVLLVLLGVLIVIGINNGWFEKGLVTAPLGDGEYIQSPIFGYYECEEGTGLSDSPDKNIPEHGSDYWCPDSSDGCDIYVRGEANTLIGRQFKYKICNKDGSTCQSERTTSIPSWWLFDDSDRPTGKLATLTNNQKITITYRAYLCLPICIYNDVTGGSVYSQYRPFILWKDTPLSGKNEYSTITQGCQFSSVDAGDLITQSDIQLQEPLDSNAFCGTNRLCPHKTYNFIESFIPLSPENYQFVNWNGEQAYCLNKKIFKINSITTTSGNYKIVDVSKNTPLSIVDCCPGEVEPNRKCKYDYTWGDLEDADCSEFKPCTGIEFTPSGSKTLVKYGCFNNKCVPEFKDVECTSDLDCLGNDKGNVCDTKTWECTKIKPPPGNVTAECKSCWNWLKDKMGIEQSCKTGFWQGIKDSLVCPLLFIKYIILGIISILAIFFGYSLVNKFFHKTVPVAIAWLLSISFGGLIFFVGYLILEWYIIIPALAILIFGTTIINSIPGGRAIRSAYRRRND